MYFENESNKIEMNATTLSLTVLFSLSAVRATGGSTFSVV